MGNCCGTRRCCNQVCSQSINHHIIVPACGGCGGYGGFGAFGGGYGGYGCGGCGFGGY